MAKTVAVAISTFGASAKAKLSNAAISGAPEDQLRGPLETLLHDLAEIGGLAAGAVNLVGETTLAHLKTRPDYAVTVSNALVGFIEVKAPGKGADPRKFSDPHDRDQWEKLKSLPNLLYTDGNAFSLWRDGDLVGKIVHVEGDVETSGAKLAAPATLVPIIDDFLRWNPIPPKTAKKLAEICDRLCRLLRDEVVEQMAHSNPGLTALAQDWRKLLFPQADDAQFADGYAQAVTFGLLVARSRDISLSGGIDHAAQELRKSNSLIATALRLLTDDVTNQEALKTSLATLTRVLDEVNWHTISKDRPEAWLYFYEDFLEVYDNRLRKRTGSYYTPPEVVSSMVNLVDEALRGPLFERSAGFAAADVIVADPAGRREEKFAALEKLSLCDANWIDCPSGWRAPFLPSATGLWATLPALSELFRYDGSGVMPGRTWIIAPDPDSLRERWALLTHEKDKTKKEILFHPHEGGDKTLSKGLRVGLVGHEHRLESVNSDDGPPIAPAHYGFRSFDRQWIIPDGRLINRPNPALWNGYSSKQIFLTAPEDRSPSSGPALTFTDLIPDLHHYNGRGGRVYPLWQDRAALQSNIKPALLIYLAKIYGQTVKAEDVMAYVAAIMSNPAFTARFQPDFVQPGLRVPITADAKLFAEAAALGAEVIWLHCYGARFVDPVAGRPKHEPRLPKEIAPIIPAGGSIPSAPELLPDAMDYDPAAQRLKVGNGYIENVTPKMWAYEVSGKQVLWQWFSYRRRDRTRPIIGDRRPPSPLDSVQPEGWLPEYTTNLLHLLHVLGRLIALEPAQADLLNRVCAGPLQSAEELAAAGAFAAPEAKASKSKGESKA